MNQEFINFPFTCECKENSNKGIIKCKNKERCCYLEYLPILQSNKDINDDTENKYLPKKPNMENAGIFVVDPINCSTLFVQSYHKYWGPPKGRMEKGETYRETALRELKEETGLILGEDKFIKTIRTRYCIFYLVFINRKDIDILSIKGNEITGIGWFNLNCLAVNLPILDDILNIAAKQLIRKYNKIIYGNVDNELNLKITIENENPKQKFLLTLKIENIS